MYGSYAYLPMQLRLKGRERRGGERGGVGRIGRRKGSGIRKNERDRSQERECLLIYLLLVCGI